MTLKQLKAFLTLVRTLNYAHASQELHISQSALSISIKSLEEELGGKLFNRNTRKVDVTNEGKSLIPYAKKLLANWEEMEKNVKQRFLLNKGTLNIASMPFITNTILPKVIKNFANKYPNINFSISDVVNENIIEMVQDGIFELGIVFEPNLRENLIFKTLYQEEFIAVVPKSHNLANAKFVSWEELSKSPFITLQAPSAIRQLIDEYCANKELQLDIKVECHQITSISSLVSSGMGVSAIPRRCINHIDTVYNALLQIQGDSIHKNVGIVYKKNHEISNITNRFIDELMDYDFSYF